VALSTIEAENISLCVDVHERVSLFKIPADLFGHEMDSTIIHCDNQSFVKLSKNPVFHDKSKEIKIKSHYIKDKVSNVFTKILARTKFEYFHERLFLVEKASLAEREF
jgi:hypothetical protein